MVVEEGDGHEHERVAAQSSSEWTVQFVFECQDDHVDLLIVLDELPYELALLDTSVLLLNIFFFVYFWVINRNVKF